MALAVPLSRFTSQVGGGSAFFVRRLRTIMPNTFDEVFHQVPDEQRRLLESMVELKLVESFGWKEPDGRWVVAFTRQGRDFINLVHAVSATNPSQRWARILALDMLADNQVVIGGYKRD